MERTIGEIDPHLYSAFIKPINFIDRRMGLPGTVFIKAVNRHKEKAIPAEILNLSGQLSQKAMAFVVNGDSLDMPFTFDKQDSSIPAGKQVEMKGNTIFFSGSFIYPYQRRRKTFVEPQCELDAFSIVQPGEF